MTMKQEGMHNKHTVEKSSPAKSDTRSFLPTNVLTETEDGNMIADEIFLTSEGIYNARNYINRIIYGGLARKYLR